MPLRFDPAASYDVQHDDVVYARPEGTELLARVYRPVGAPAGDRPALVDLHGGAWRYFDRKVDTYYNRALAACGMVVVALDFRQAPDHQWPSATLDVATGLHWVEDHAAELGASTADIGLIGGSSGGQLALEVGILDKAVVYVLALWPVSAPDWRYRYALDRIANPRPSSEPLFDPERLCRAQEEYFGDEARMALASVPRMLEDGMFAHLPPVWVAQPELDENVPVEMTERLADAYRAAGGDIEVALFPRLGHGFANYGGDDADRCIEQMAAFIGAHFATRPAVSPGG
ncbi:MAG TPA: alpha/beta hydrolase [Acidimicrobiia bacterium]|nr:alpha/beta hydrolase [Acidimicrobiia bacterium]